MKFIKQPAEVDVINPELAAVEDAPASKNQANAGELLTVGLSANPDEIEAASTVSLIEGFIEYNTVSILYGDSGSGKSLMMLSVCVWLLENSIIERINYYDFDNGTAEHKNRGVHHLIRRYGDRFNYINLDSIDKADITPPQILEGLCNTEASYSKQFFIFDTMGELAEGSLSKDEIMRPLLDKFKKLRSMGATVYTIHHTTKSKEDVSFFGSNYIKIKIDALWHLTAKEGTDKGKMEFALKNVKNRSGNLKDNGFIIEPDTHTLGAGDYRLASMGEDDNEFVSSIRAVLSEYELISQSELLKEIGTSSDDKTARGRLKKFDGVFWQSKRVSNKGNALMYSLSKDT